MYGITRDVIEGYGSWCAGCWDYYAVQQADGSYRPTYQRLTLTRLADHLMGRYTLGTYVLDAAGTCSFVVFDADGADGLDRLMRLAGDLAASGISSVMEASRRGGHLWVFLDRPTSGRLVRAWLGPYAVAYGVEFYPKQEVLGPDGIGSLVRVPLGVHRVSGGWYPFVVWSGAYGKLLPVGDTVADCCAWLGMHARRVVVPAELDVVGVDECADVGDGGEQQAAGAGGHGTRGMIRRWCRMQDIVEVVGRYTVLNGRGVGRCPLPGHHHRRDVRPSFQVFGGTDPHWYCYTWKRAGDLFDFLCLVHGWSDEQGWEKLQAGMLL